MFITHRSFVWIDEVYLDDDLELAPAGLADLVRGLHHDPVLVGVALVQLEVDLLHVRRHVLVVVGLHVDGPLVRVPVLLALLPEVPRHVPVNDRFHYADALKILR